MGFRAQHHYFPESGIAFAVTLNSVPAEDDSARLAEALYNTLVAHGVVSTSDQRLVAVDRPATVARLGTEFSKPPRVNG